MTKKYFGTDGIRGRVGEAPITPDFMLRLGYAAGMVLAERAHDIAGVARPAVLIGKDTRVSGYMLEAALEAGFAAAGVDVVLVGPLPTSGIAYLTRAHRLQAGLAISASHNAFEDNGIKFFNSGGWKLADAVEQAIEDALQQPMRIVAPLQLGKARRLDDARGRYIEFCKSVFPNHMRLSGLKLVVDCAHGAAYHVAPDVFHELGAEVIPIHNEPDGFNINANCGTTHITALQSAVQAHQADLGIALDGDGDRLFMVDRHSNVLDGDLLLYLIARSRRQNGQLTGGVVGTVMTNMAIEHAFEKEGTPFVRANVGDRCIVEQLQKRDWQVGGESSGHLLCLDQHTTGDGIISALLVLQALGLAGQTLDTILGDLCLYPQRLCNVHVPKGFDVFADPQVGAVFAEAERALHLRGRVVLRASGTEPVVRIMVEAHAAEDAEHWANALVAIVSKAVKTPVLVASA